MPLSPSVPRGLRQHGELDEASTGLVAGLLVAAGFVHFSLTPAHLEEWWGYGLAFGGVAVAQVVLGAAVGARRGRHAPAAAVAVSGLAILAWALSRTTGLPFAAGHRLRESPGALDLVTVLTEAVTVALLVGVPRRLLAHRSLAVTQVLGAVLVATVAVAFAAGIGHE